MADNKNTGSPNVENNPKMKAGGGVGQGSVQSGDRNAMKKGQTGSGNVGMEDDEESYAASEDTENEDEEDTEQVGRAIPAGGGKSNQSSSTKGV
jgi:hypothetical protein